MDVKEVLRDYVTDMLGVEKHTLESIERQRDDSRMKNYREAHQLVMCIERTLNTHILALEQYLSSINGGGIESAFKKAASSAVGALSGLYSKVRGGDPVSRDMRDNYSALSLVAISYTMLHTTARALDDNRLADLALKHLHDITPLVVSLSKVIPVLVAQELTDEGKVIFPEAGLRAVESTQKAWSCEVIGTC